MSDQAGSLRNGHKNKGSAGTEQKLDSSERNNNSNDKTIWVHSIDKQKEKRVDDNGERKEDQQKNGVKYENGNEVVQEDNNVSDEEEGQVEFYVIGKIIDKGDEKPENVIKGSDEKDGQRQEDVIKGSDRKDGQTQEGVTKRI